LASGSKQERLIFFRDFQRARRARLSRLAA
jgi:hypothetical protein